MDGLQLDSGQQATLRSLLHLEPVPGRPLPEQPTLDLLAALVPCDTLAASFTDLHGHFLSIIETYPHRRRRGQVTSTVRTIDPGPCPGGKGTGPHYLGYMHWNKHPREAEGCEVVISNGDILSVGFRNGTAHIVQYDFERVGRRFTEGELQLLWMLSPVLGRLARERPTPQLPATLTLTERRVLSHAAAGRTNAQIAEDMFVAVATVRKHLENAYRKLGVTNRVAAIARLNGSDAPGLDLLGRVERYA